MRRCRAELTEFSQCSAVSTVHTLVRELLAVRHGRIAGSSDRILISNRVTCSRSEKNYQLKRGDSLCSIVTGYGVDVAAEQIN